jgi:hypothetical protein
MATETSSVSEVELFNIAVSSQTGWLSCQNDLIQCEDSRARMATVLKNPPPPQIIEQSGPDAGFVTALVIGALVVGLVGGGIGSFYLFNRP